MTLPGVIPPIVVPEAVGVLQCKLKDLGRFSKTCLSLNRKLCIARPKISRQILATSTWHTAYLGLDITILLPWPTYRARRPSYSSALSLWSLLTSAQRLLLSFENFAKSLGGNTPAACFGNFTMRDRSQRSADTWSFDRSNHPGTQVRCRRAQLSPSNARD